jgi:hypothetical protein
MKYFQRESLLIVGVFLSILFMSIVFAYLPRHGEIVYNCSIAEISPDIPVAVKEQCRKLRMEQK